MHLTIIVIFILLAIAYLCDLFGQFRRLEPAYDGDGHLSLIEHLTRHKMRTKEYGRKPEGFSSFNRKLEGRRKGEEVVFRYEFPLVQDQSGVFHCTLEPTVVSGDVDTFGAPTSLLDNSMKDAIALRPEITEEEYRKRLNADGMFFRDRSDWGVDYAAIVLRHKGFTKEIAASIYNDLSTRGLDSKRNRVQAALHFVQFIPYGVPEFDTPEWLYHGLALPQESFVLGYSDCDSKSVFLASILTHLIPAKEILLVVCEVRSAHERNNGHHMMVAVAGLGISGERISHDGRDFLLLETTVPLVMGRADWHELKVNQLITL